MIFKKIKQLCDERKISVRQVEIRTGLSTGLIGKWKTAVPQVDKLKRVADYFGVPIEYFLEE